MRIALYNLTTTTKIGGVESFVWDVSRELASRGHTVTIIGGAGSRREAVPGVRVLTYPFISRRFWQALPLMRRAYAEAKLLERLTMGLVALPELVRGGYDIIHLQKPYDMAPALLARWLGGARVILGCHGEDWYYGDWLLARHVDGAVSCSHFNANTVAARYLLTPRVIFNGIDTTLFQPGAPDPALRQCAPLLLYVGRLQTWKGIDTAIRALAHMSPTPRLLIAGSGEADVTASLEHLAVEVGVRDYVDFLGAVPRHDLPRLYRSADVLLAPSFASETFGISLVEAQACGLPVVATRFGGFPEVVDEGRTGLLILPQHPEALATAVMHLLNDPARRAAMAAAAPAWAAQFTWSAVVDRVEAAYRSVV